MSAAQIADIIFKGILESIKMTIISSFIAYLFGLVLGILLVLTKSEGLRPNSKVNLTINSVVNILRSVPFLILLIAVMPITRLITGTTIGSNATIVPLVIAAFPFVARLVESALTEVDKGIIEAAESMGATATQIVIKVMLPESLPSLMNGMAIALTTILGYSAMAGAVGGGGLGDIAIRYGYYRYQKEMMALTILALILLVQVFQFVAEKANKMFDKRNY